MVNKLFNNLIESIPEYTQKKEMFFIGKLMPEISYYPQDLIKALGGARKIHRFPVIKLTDKNYTGNGEISVESEDMFSNVCRGLDKFNRPFIAMAIHEKQGPDTTSNEIINIFKWASSDGTFKNDREHSKQWSFYSRNSTSIDIENLFKNERPISLDSDGTVLVDGVVANILANKGLKVLVGIIYAISLKNSVINFFSQDLTHPVILTFTIVGAITACVAIKIIKQAYAQCRL